MTRRSFLIRCALLALLCCLPLLASGQTLNIANDSQTYTTLTNTTVTMSGRAELKITGTGDPIPGCTINLTSPDAWFYLTNIQPATVSSTFLSRVRVNGASAVLDGNVRIVQHGTGAVVVPHAPTFSPLEVFNAQYFAGTSKHLYSYVKYDDQRLGGMRGSIRSFKLKHGYMATFAETENGTGFSKCYVAQEGDLEVGKLPANLDRAVHFVRVFPWRWTAKKGIAGNIEPNLNVRWLYNWNLDRTSPLNWEYVPIKQIQYWPSLDQDWKYRGATHVLGFNEPDHTDQANLTVAQALAGWPELMATGLRIGAPAVSDGGRTWLYDFIAQADAAGLRVDYVPIHYYWCFNPADAAGAANQMYNFLKGVYDTVKRPLWVTEWNNGANWTGCGDPTFAQQAAAVQAMIDMLDNAPFVERYSIYNWVEDVRRVCWDDNSPTDAGVVYRDHAAPLAYLQEMADAGTGNSARYDFDGNAHDSWGHGQDGMIVGAPTFVPGKYGQALQFDGTDYVQLSPRIADTTDFTFAAWIWWNGGANWQRVFDFGFGTSNYLALTMKAGTAGMRFMMRDGGGEQQLNTATPAVGAWVHVAVTIAGDTGKLFVNGAVVDTNTAMTINPVDVDTKYNFLGKSQFADPLFNGRLDDVRIVSSALTDAQILAIYQTGPPQFSSTTLAKPSAVEQQPYTGSIAADATGGSGARTFTKMSGPAWLAVARDGGLSGVPNFEDAGVNNFSVRVTDANGALHATMLQIPVAEAGGIVAHYGLDGTANTVVGTAHGTPSGAPAYTTGHNGFAIDLDGVDDFVTLPAGVASSDEITIAAWVNWDGGNAWQRVFDFGNGNGEYFFLTPKSSANTLRFGILNAGTAEQQLNAALLPTGAWTHVAVTLGAGTGRLYVNGALVNTATITLKPSDIAPVVNFIGKSQWSADPLFNGRVDDFAVFNTALSATQIAALMNGHAPVFTADTIAKPTATAGTAYNHSLALNAGDPDAGSVLTFSKVSGPAWLTVAADGRISGLPGANDAGVNRFIVRVTDATLLADEAVMNLTVSAPSAGLVTQYQFDGNVLNVAGGGAGTASGSPAYENAIFDKALGFDGSNDFVTMPANIVGALTDATFALRVRWDGGSAWQRIFDFGGGTGQYMILTPSSGSGTAQFAILNSGGTAQRLAGPDPLPVGEWAHVAVTLIGNTGTLYVNGAAVASTSITIDPAAIAQTANYLGDSQFSADPFFKGALDDFRIYNRGLSAAEILALASPPAPTAVALDYPGWTTAYAFAGGQSGAAADPDNDGVPNAFEFLLGSNPLAASANTLPAAQIRTAAQLGIGGDPAKTYLSCQIRVRKQRPGITLAPEAAATLAGLAAPVASDALQAGTPVSDGDFEIITYYYRIALQDSPTAFLRVRLTMP